MPDIAAQIETALAVMQLFDQIKALLPEGVAAIRHYPNATALARRERYVPTTRAPRSPWIRQEPWRPYPASRRSSLASRAISRRRRRGTTETPWRKRRDDNGCPLDYFATSTSPSSPSGSRKKTLRTAPKSLTSPSLAPCSMSRCRIVSKLSADAACKPKWSSRPRPHMGV